MRNVNWTSLIFLTLMAGLVVKLAGQPLATAERPPVSSHDCGLMMATAAATDGGQHLVVIDTRDRVIGTYHVDAASGALSLRSVRTIRWDLRMNEFNGGEPKPNEIRALLEQN